MKKTAAFKRFLKWKIRYLADEIRAYYIGLDNVLAALYPLRVSDYKVSLFTKWRRASHFLVLKSCRKSLIYSHPRRQEAFPEFLQLFSSLEFRKFKWMPTRKVSNNSVKQRPCDFDEQLTSQDSSLDRSFSVLHKFSVPGSEVTENFPLKTRFLRPQMSLLRSGKTSTWSLN